MKRFFYFSILAAMFLTTSCKNELASDTGGLPFKSSENGKWGLIANDGTVIFEEEFKDCPTSAHNNLCMVKNGQGLWEIYTVESKPEKIGDEYTQIGDFYADVAPAVKKNEKITLINKKGEVVATLDKAGSNNITGVSNFSYGYARFKAGEDYGIIDTKGNVVIPAKYAFIAPVQDGRFAAVDSKYKDEETKNSVLSILDTKGNIVTSIKLSKYDDIGDITEIINFGGIPVKVTADGESQWGFIDIKGEVVLKPSAKIRQLGKLKGQNFTFNDGTSWGVRNLKDEIVIRPKYSLIDWATDDLLWTYENKDGHAEWTLIDLNDNKITKDNYINVLPFMDGQHAAVQITDKSWGFIDKEGNELKNLPDIYEIRDHAADSWLESDFVDFDAIVSDLKMTEKSLGEYSLDMQPSQVAKIYAENNYKEGQDRIEATPEGVGQLNSLSYEKTVEGVSVNYTLGYAEFEYITNGSNTVWDSKSLDWITTPATWSDAKPAYLSVSISGGKIQTKTKECFSHVASRLKSIGKVYKENDNAIIVSVAGGQRGYVAYHNGRSIEIALFGSDGYKEYSIDQFATVDTSNNEFTEESVDINDTSSFDDGKIDMLIDQLEGFVDKCEELNERSLEGDVSVLNEAPAIIAKMQAIGNKLDSYREKMSPSQISRVERALLSMQSIQQ